MKVWEGGLKIKIHNLSKQDKIALLFFILILIGLLIVATFLPDNRPGIIRDELVRQGYDVEHVEFEFFKSIRSSQWVFRSSEPIFFDENYVTYWLLIRHNYGLIWSHLRIVHTVEPYMLELEEQLK